MKYLKLFEQFEDDPFGEEVYGNELIPMTMETTVNIGDEIYNIDDEYIGIIIEIKPVTDDLPMPFNNLSDDIIITCDSTLSMFSMKTYTHSLSFFGNMFFKIKHKS